MSETPSALGPYPVERELGRGGMGVVYLGRDPRLNRPVAIKVLPDLLAKNPESLARFEREARLLASVNHPNIATIYGIEEDAGRRLLVLEYIPGDTLAERLAKGPLPVDESIDICRQIALAIEAAHEAGVIHRDLKPGNVKITPDGQVKVLDFGLAKGSEPVSNAELALSPTMTFAATGMGVILGTAGYMSPEQARGKAVDRRTDIWSFGCVLFECLAGKQIFEGETVSDTIAKILERDPNWAALPPQTPARVRDLLRRCLEKDLKKRQRDIGDVRIELEEAAAARSSSMRMATDSMTVAAPPTRSSLKTVAVATLLIVAGAAAGIGAWKLVGSGTGSTNTGVIRASIAVPRSIHAFYLGVSNDGRTIGLTGVLRNPDGSDDTVQRAFSRRIDDYEFKPVPGAERYLALNGSPNGEQLAIVKYVSEQSTQRELITLPRDGSSPPVKVADFGTSWSLELAWLNSGDFLIGAGDGQKYFRLPRNHSAPGPELSFDIEGARFAAFGGALPKDRGVFVHVTGYTAKGYTSDAWVLDLRTNKTHRLVDNAGSIGYSPTGHIVFSRNDTLMAAAFDLETLQVTGDVIALSKDLLIVDAWRHGRFSMSQQGTLAYAPGGLVGNARRLVSIDTSGSVVPFGTDRRAYEKSPVVSDDGRRVAVVIANEKATYEIWATDPDRQSLTRLIAIPNVDCDTPTWSPDGRRIAYTRFAQDKDDGVYVVNSDGSGTPQLVMGAGGPAQYVNAYSWTRDSTGLIVTKNIKAKGSLWLVPVPTGGAPAAPRALRTTSYSDDTGKISPDGRFIAFSSDESGKTEIYVATYGAGGILGRPWRVSDGAAGSISWARDRGRLFFNTSNGKLMSVTVDAKPTLTASTPVIAHDLTKLRVSGWWIHPDGHVFAIQGSEAEYEIPSFNIVFNWFDELRARMAKGAGK